MYYERHLKNIFLLSIFLLINTHAAFGQAPHINYGSYKIFVKDSVFEPLFPINKGGEIPPTIYGSTTTIAGSDLPGYMDGHSAKARFNQPTKIAVDKVGNLFVSDAMNHCIRKISSEGLVTTIAGNGKQGYVNSNNGLAASFNHPSGIAVDKSGNIYVADVFNHVIRKISFSGSVSTFAGNGLPGYKNGKGIMASFTFPVDLTVDETGNIFVVDEGNQRIRKITTSGLVTSFAGNGSPGLRNDVSGQLAEFNQPNGVAIDLEGNLYVADQLNHVIRKITPKGSVSTLAGNGLAGSADNEIGTLASFNNPRSITVNQAGFVFVGDIMNQRIRKITPNGAVSTLAGTGAPGSHDNANGLVAGFYFPNGLAVDSFGNLYVADCLNNKIRKVQTTGYTVIPELLPEGLFFDYTTGVFTGRPISEIANRNFIVTGHNIYGSSSATLNISVSTEPGNALYFDGIDDKVAIQDNPSFHTPVITVEAWANIKKLSSSFGRIVLKRNDLGSYDDSYSIGIDSFFHFRAVVCSGSGTIDGQKSAVQNSTINKGEWNYVAAVFKTDSIKLYVNGELEKVTYTGFPLNHGNNQLLLGFDEKLEFLLDEVRIYNTDRSMQIADDGKKQLLPNTPGLVAYYNFNSGRAGLDNSGINTVVDISPEKNYGNLLNFQNLSGSQSNWVDSYAMMTPELTMASDISRSAFTAEWNAPASGKVDHYLLDVSEDKNFSTFLTGYHNLEIAGTSKRIGGLKERTTYFFRIRSSKKGENNISSYTKTITVSTVSTLKTEE